jgi:hypothetical protein
MTAKDTAKSLYRAVAAGDVPTVVICWTTRWSGPRPPAFPTPARTVGRRLSSRAYLLGSAVNEMGSRLSLASWSLRVMTL